MYLQHSDLLVRARMAELARSSQPRVRSRNSLQIMLDARRARRQSLAG